ncbi:MAG: ABC transporter permease [Desulfurococcaceae archaeon]
MIRKALAVFKAYFLSDFVRSSGLLYGLLSMSMWILLFIVPMSLFAGPDVKGEAFSAYAFTAVLVFLSYNMATWDWAAELRWLINRGMLEYVIASGAGFIPLYSGIMPVSLIWMGFSLTAIYVLLTLVMGQPTLIVVDPLALAIGLAMLIVVLLGYALILGGTAISTGSVGPVMEIISWILPIATGGLTPLRNVPEVLRRIALATPFSYPAELIRYSLLGIKPVVELNYAITVGALYAGAFMLIAIAYFKLQIRKILKEGIKTISMY